MSFCAASSAAYLVNDAADVEADRRHPTKRFRPIAAGVVPVDDAPAGSPPRWSSCSFGVMALTGQPMAVGYVAIYLVITFAYSAGLKRVAVIDLIIVASGFVLRALAGAVAVDVYVSDWFLIVTTFGSLFVVAGKRFAEIREVGRRSRDPGHARDLHRALPAADRRRRPDRHGHLLLPVRLRASRPDDDGCSRRSSCRSSRCSPPCCATRSCWRPGAAGLPEEVFASDRWLQLLGLTWAVLFAIGVYGK